MLATLHTNSVQVTPTEQTNNFQAFLIQTTLENTESTTVTDGSKPDHQHPSNLVSAKKQNQYSDNQDLYYAKATFDFNIKCLPNGQLEHGTDTDIRLRSTSIDRIVILGNKATFNGTAIVNGEEEHTFNVTVVDTGHGVSNLVTGGGWILTEISPPPPPPQ